MAELAERLGATTAGEPLETSAVQAVRRLYDAYRFGEWEGLEALLHPYARFLPLAAGAADVLGPDDLLAFVAARSGDPRFDLAEVEVTQLAADAVLCVAHPSRRRKGSVPRAAIVTLEDGLLLRERAFASAPDAYRAYLRDGVTLGL